MHCRKRKNFRSHNISLVKFLRREIFVSEGSPQKFNYHKNLIATKGFTPQTLTHETKWGLKI